MERIFSSFSCQFKQKRTSYIISLETLKFNELSDKDDLKSNLTTKINQKENTRDILLS